MKKTRSIEALPIDTSMLCCNFVNTVFAWKGEGQYDFLSDYDAFIDWCIKLDVSSEGNLTKLRQKAQKDPAEAEAVMIKIRNIRLLLHDFISSIAANDQKKIEELLMEINPLIEQALAQIKFAFSDNMSFTISFQKNEADLINPVWVVLKSLYDLITAKELIRVKECPACGWVFFDETKNGKRRWCNPLNCGTKDKMDRYKKRRKEQNKQ